MLVATRLLSIPAAALLIATGPALEDVAFHAQEGTSVVRTFTFENEQELSAFEITVNGEEVPPEYIEGVEMLMHEVERIVVTDQYGPLLDGRPEVLRRTFEELSGVSTEESTGPEGESDETSDDKSSPLEGATVVFTWDEDEQAYSAEFEAGGDEDLLDDLVEDMDLRGFLPEGFVEQGDSWEPGIEAFNTLLESGGDLQLTAESGDDSGMDEQLEEQLSDNLEGEVRVTYAGVRTEDGVEVAVLEIEVSAETQGEGLEEDDEGGEIQTTVAVQFELEGELTWNLRVGCLHGLELAGTLSSQMTFASEMAEGGELMEFVQGMSFEGPVSFSVSVEVQ